MSEFSPAILFKAAAFLFAATFFIRLPIMCRPANIHYKVLAQTDDERLDHTYQFHIVRLKDGSYRCYIERAPILFEKNFSRYAMNFAEEPVTHRRFIFHNDTITNAREAMRISEKWANANQVFVDFHRAKPL